MRSFLLVATRSLVAVSLVDSEIVNRVRLLGHVSKMSNQHFDGAFLKKIYDNYEEGHVEFDHFIVLSWMVE